MSLTLFIRDRRQIILPSEIVAAAGLQTDDMLEASYLNGVIQLVPTRSKTRCGDMGRFLGSVEASYGTADAAVNHYVSEQRDAW